MGRRDRQQIVRARAVRTCVGCRSRAEKPDLLRVVIAGDDAKRVLPDERGRAPGRGAHLHPTLVCLDRAERRRAFAHALRVEGALDTSALRRYVEELRPRSPEPDVEDAPDGARHVQ